MTLPPVHSLKATEYLVIGAVTVHPSAAIAPGVILEAAPGQQIIIGAGVCIGIGSVLVAQQGTIEIAPEVTLAPGSLIVGPVAIGQGACIGSRSTICQQDVAAETLIVPGSLLQPGVPSPRVHPPSPTNSPRSPLPASNPRADAPNTSQHSEHHYADPLPSPWDEDESPPVSPPPSKSLTSKANKTASEEDIPIQPTEVVTPKNHAADSEETPTKSPVVGRVYINQLLVKLFPERKSLQ